MRARAALAGALAAGLVGVLAGVLAGCGGQAGTGGRGQLTWKGTPLLFRATHLPDDRVLIGSVRNRSGRAVHLVAAAVGVRDAGGASLRAYAQFSNSYAHGLYGAYQKPTPLPPDEIIRLGGVTTLPPGATAPLTVAFRITSRTRRPLRIDYGSGWLPVPARTRRESQ